METKTNETPQRELLTCVYNCLPKDRVKMLLEVESEMMTGVNENKIYRCLLAHPEYHVGDIARDTGIDVANVILTINNTQFVVEDIYYKSVVEKVKSDYKVFKLKRFIKEIETELGEYSPDFVKLSGKLIDMENVTSRELLSDDGSITQEVEDFKNGVGIERVELTIPSLNTKLGGGVGKKEILVVGGLPSGGKSIFMENQALFTAFNNKKVLFFSTEMSKKENLGRMMAMVRGMGLASDKDIAIDLISSLSTLRIYERVRRFAEIQLEIRRQAALGPIDLIIIDHLHDIELDDNRDERMQLNEICTEMLNIAMKYNSAVLLASQLVKIDGKQKITNPFLGTQRIKGIAHCAVVLNPRKDENGKPTGYVTMIVNKNRGFPTWGEENHVDMYGNIELKIDRFTNMVEIDETRQDQDINFYYK